MDRLTDQADALTLGPPRTYRPVSIFRPGLGYYGGPIGYELVDPDQADVGPIVIQHEDKSKVFVVGPV
jgi:hypothetical protein